MAEIRVFHSASCEVKRPSLSYDREESDFGSGFCVTTDQEIAERWAARRGHTVINVYMIDLEELNGLGFGLDKGWLDFVVRNRRGCRSVETDLFDIDYIQGIAIDDRLFALVERYESDPLNVDVVVEKMNAMDSQEQIVLISEESVQSLEFCESYWLSAE